MAKRKLLLADDSVTIQKVVNLTFADEGIEVITVGDGDSAIQKIAEVSPDVVLADVHMPGLNGYQICERVRENPATQNLPVVLLVGSFEPFDENEAARVGANAYLTKPFQSIRQLVSQVSDLLEKPAANGTAEAGETNYDVSAPGFDTPETVSNDVSPQAPVGRFAEAAQAPEVAETPRVPEVNDIDSLYHRSFSGHDAEIEAPSPHYVDEGMDDEMIETRHVDGDDDGAIGDGGETMAQEQNFDVVDHSAFDAVEENRFDATSEARFDTIEETRFDVAEEKGFDTFGEARFDVPDQTEAAPSAPFDSVAHVSAGDQDSGEVAYFDQFPEAEPTSDADDRPTREFQFDEADPLDLPPIVNGTNIQDEIKQVVNLSPEQMEMIVQKVVDKLSEKD